MSQQVLYDRPFSVVIADENPRFSSNLQNVIQKEFPLCIATTVLDRNELLESARKSSPDIIVMSRQIADDQDGDLSTVKSLWGRGYQALSNVIIVSDGQNWKYLQSLQAARGQSPRTYGWLRSDRAHLRITRAINHILSLRQPWIDFNVLLVDDHEIFRAGFENELRLRFPSLLEVRSQAAFSMEEDVERFKPDIVVLDIQLRTRPTETIDEQEPDGLELAGQIWRRHPCCPIVIATSNTSLTYVQELEKIRSRRAPVGWIAKENAIQRIGMVISSILRGQSNFEDAEPLLDYQLTPKEVQLQTLGYTAIGLTDIEIARLSGVTDRAIGSRLQKFSATLEAAPTDPWTESVFDSDDDYDEDEDRDAPERTRTRTVWLALKIGLLTPATLLKYEARCHFIKRMQERALEALFQSLIKQKCGKAREARQIVIAIRDELARADRAESIPVEEDLSLLTYERVDFFARDPRREPIWPARLVELMCEDNPERRALFKTKLIKYVLICKKDKNVKESKSQKRSATNDSESEQMESIDLDPDTWKMPKDRDLATAAISLLGSWLLLSDNSEEQDEGRRVIEWILANGNSSNDFYQFASELMSLGQPVLNP